MIDQENPPERLRTPYGTFIQYTFPEPQTGKKHVALTLGKWAKDRPVPVRIHSECLTGDVFGSARCDCGDQLDLALQAFQSWGVGILVYLRQEGRGIGLLNKIKAYQLQDQGLDTVDANLALGFSADERKYDLAAEILKRLEVSTISLLTNNPDKMISMRNLGIDVVDRIPIESNIKPEARNYMRTKTERMGHISSPEPVGVESTFPCGCSRLMAVVV